MKLQLDYDNKSIRLEQSTNLGDFIEKISTILPDFKDWTLTTTTIQNWGNPWIATPIQSNPIPSYIPTTDSPWWISYQSPDYNPINCNVRDFAEPTTGTFNISA